MAWSSADFNFDGYIFLYKKLGDVYPVDEFECEGDLASWLIYKFFQKCHAYINVDGFSKKELDTLEQYSSYVCTGKGMKSKRKKYKTLKELFPKFFTDKGEVRKYVKYYKQKYW